MSTILTKPYAGNSLARIDSTVVLPRGSTVPRATWVCRYDYILMAALGAALVMWALTGLPITPVRPWIVGALRENAVLTAIALGILAAARFAKSVARHRRTRRRLVIGVVRKYFGGATLWNSARYLVALLLVLTVYSSIKQAIPLVNPATWDAQFIAFERWLHLGWNPAWDLAKIGWPRGWLILLDCAYYLWFPLMPLVGAYFLAHRDRARSEHFLAAFMLLWLAAVVISLAIPSHGPCYVDLDRFPPRDMVMCRVTQDWLWENYQRLVGITLPGNGGMVFGCGLVALPSLHVAVCCLYAIFLWREGSIWRWSSLLYAILVFLGSVHSGWHYAIDGYAGLLLALFATGCTGMLPSSVRPPVPRTASPRATAISAT